MTVLRSYQKKIVLGSASKPKVQKDPYQSWDRKGLEVGTLAQSLERGCFGETLAAVAHLRLTVVEFVAALVADRDSALSERHIVVDTVRDLQTRSNHAHRVCWDAHRTHALYPRD